jgi:hypothetical protein
MTLIGEEKATGLLTIKVTGIAGYCKGSEHVIEKGGELVIGRSRSATMRIAPGDEASDTPTDKPYHGTGEKEKHFLTVSGQHVKLTFKDASHIYIHDLSKHGTWLEGQKIDGRDQISGLSKGAMELRLGTNETLRLEMIRTPAKPRPKITVKRRGA